MLAKMSPEEMMGELNIVTRTLNAPSVYVIPGGNPDAAQQDTILFAADAQGAQPCAACSGRGMVEAKTHAMPGR